VLAEAAASDGADHPDPRDEELPPDDGEEGVAKRVVGEQQFSLLDSRGREMS
jgi:hypothetical protein